MKILQLMKKIGVLFNKSAGSFQRLNRDPKEWIEEITAKNSIRNVEFDVRIIPAPEINDTIDTSLMNVMVQTFNANRFETTSEAKFTNQSMGWEKIE